MASTVDLIKERLSVAEVIGSYLKLEKAGANFKARCPFHNEKTPSFMVSPSRGTYYCFGCGEKGDLISFVERFEGVDFKGALRILAERAGVPLTFERKEDKDERDQLFSLMEEAASFYRANLEASFEATAYLEGRGLTKKTIEDFSLGYAKPEWRGLLSHLREKGFKDSDIERAGLIKKPDAAPGKDYYDRFRGRIMFPISDAAGRVIAFSGRIFDEMPGSAGEGAKYINSPETPLFSKSKVLYGYDKAKEGIRKWGFAILVEGQMDLLMSHQAGFRNTMALSGTALTPEHLVLIERLTDKLVLALDADAAGLAAAGKSAALALTRGFDVKAARVAIGKDPAELVKTDPELWKKAVREATHIIEFYLDVLEAQKLELRKFRQEVSRLAIPLVVHIDRKTDQNHFAKVVGERIGLSESAVIEEMNLVRKKAAAEERGHHTALPETAFPTGKPRSELVAERLILLYIAEEAGKKGKIAFTEVESALTELLGPERFAKMLEYARLSPNTAFAADMLYESSDTLSAEAEELILSLKRQTMREQFESRMAELKRREREGDAEGAAALLAECHELARALAALDQPPAS